MVFLFRCLVVLQLNGAAKACVGNTGVCGYGVVVDVDDDANDDEKEGEDDDNDENDDFDDDDDDNGDSIANVPAMGIMLKMAALFMRLGDAMVNTGWKCWCC